MDRRVALRSAMPRAPHALAANVGTLRAFVRSCSIGPGHNATQSRS
jgi:hypothetical protein